MDDFEINAMYKYNMKVLNKYYLRQSNQIFTIELSSI